MSEVIRKAIVEIEYKVTKSDLKVDTSSVDKAVSDSAAKSSQATQRILQDIASHNKALLDLHKTAADTAAEEKAQAKLAAASRAAAAEARKQQKEQERAAAAAAKAVEKAAKDQEVAVAKATAEYNKQVEAIERNQKAATAANLAAAESFKTAAEGAFTLVRGVALLGVSNEKDLQKVFQTLAQIQGAMDIFRGGSQLFLGVVKGMQALQAASAAAAAAEVARASATGVAGTASVAATGAATAQAAANTAVGTTATTAAVGLTAMQVAMGPIGIATLALTAAIAAAAAITYALTSETIDNTKAEEEATRQRNALADASERLSTATARQRDLAKVEGGTAGQQRLIALNAQLKQRELSQPEIFEIGFRVGGATPDQGNAAIERLEQEQKLVNDRLAVTREILEIGKRSHETKIQELETQRGLVEETKREAEAKRQAAQQLQSQQESLELSFGKLRGGERVLAERLLGKAREGTLSESEARRLEELGLATEETRAAKLAGARSRGSTEAISGLRAGDGTFASEQTRLRSEAERAVREAAEAERKIGGEIASHQESIRSIQQSLVATVDSLGRTAEFLDSTLIDLRRRVEQIEERARGAS